MKWTTWSTVKKYNSILMAAVFLWGDLSLALTHDQSIPQQRLPAAAEGTGSEVVALPILANSELSDGKTSGSEKVDKAALTAAMIQKMLLDESTIQRTRGSVIKDHALEHAKQLLYTVHKDAALQLAPQQLLFTAVIGSVTFMDFANALKDDPKATETALIDGWGALAVGGFWLMMGTTGYSGFVTQTYFANSPTGRIMIPTLGLGAGMFAMGHLGAVFSNPSVQLCGKLGTQFIQARGSKTLSAEDRQIEIAQRRTQLFKDYNVDPLSNPCTDAWAAVTNFAEQYPTVAGAILTSLMLQTVSHQVLNRLTARYATQVANSGTATGRLLAQKGKKIQEHALQHGVRTSTGAALGQALTAGLAFSRGSGGAVKMAWGFKAVTGVFTQMAVHLAIFIKVHHKIQPHVTAMWHGLAPFSGLGSYLDGDGAKIEKHVARIRQDNWQISGAEKDIPFEQLDQKCITQARERLENAKKLGVADHLSDESEIAKCFEMNALLEKLTGHMYDWRANKLLVKTQMAHQMWKQSLQAYQNAVKSSQILYRELIRANMESEQDLLSSRFSTFGIRRPGAGKSNKDFLRDPNAYIAEQRAHIEKVIQVFGENFPKLKAEAAFAQIFELLKSSDLEKVGQGLLSVSEIHKTGLLNQKPVPVVQVAAYQWLFEELGEPTPMPEPGRGFLNMITEIEDNRSVFISSQNLYNSWLHREGFWNWLTYYPSKYISSVVQGTSFGGGMDSAELAQRAGWDRISQDGKTTHGMDWYTQTWAGQNLPDVGFGVSFVPWLGDMIYNSFKTSSFRRYLAPNVVDKLVQQMACGPEASKNEKVAAWVHGYTPSFIPPAIVKDPAHARKEICETKGNLLNLPVSQLYTDSFKAANGKTHQGIIDYVRKNLLAEVQTPEQFDAWWNKHVETENQKIYEQFRVYYDSLVVHTWKAIYAPDSYGRLHVTRIQKSLNSSEVGENTVIGSLEQQLKIALALTQDLYISGLLSQTNDDSVLTKQLGKEVQDKSNKPKSEGTPILAGVRSSNALRLENFIGGTSKLKTAGNLKYVDDILKEFRSVMEMMSNAQVILTQVDGQDRQFFQAKYTFSELKKRTANLTRIIDSEISSRFEIEGKKEEPLAKLMRSLHKVDAPKVQVKNPVTARTIEILRQMALQVVSEMEMYGGTFALVDLNGEASQQTGTTVKMLSLKDFKKQNQQGTADIPLIGVDKYED